MRGRVEALSVLAWAAGGWAGGDGPVSRQYKREPAPGSGYD